MATEDYVSGFNHACLFPYYGVPVLYHKDIFDSYKTLIFKLQFMYDRSIQKQERLRLTILYLTHVDPERIESVKRIYIKLSNSEMMMFENKNDSVDSMLINSQSLEYHARSLKFTTPGYFFSEHGYTNVVTGRTFHFQRILPVVALVAVAGVYMWRRRI